jgi:hypothetical protein
LGREKTDEIAANETIGAGHEHGSSHETHRSGLNDAL